MKVLVDLTHHYLGEGEYEVLDYNYIPYSAHYATRDCISEDLSAYLNDMIDSLELSDGMKSNKAYCLVMEIDITYTSDYYNEADCDWEAKLVDHKMLGTIQPDGSILYDFCEDKKDADEVFELGLGLL